MALELSATELVRNFADYLNRVAYRGDQYVIVRGGKPVAELRPLPFARRLGELPALLASLPRLGPDEAAAFEHDIDRARDELSRMPLVDPWASSWTRASLSLTNGGGSMSIRIPRHGPTNPSISL